MHEINDYFKEKFVKLNFLAIYDKLYLFPNYSQICDIVVYSGSSSLILTLLSFFKGLHFYSNAFEDKNKSAGISEHVLHQ